MTRPTDPLLPWPTIATARESRALKQLAALLQVDSSMAVEMDLDVLTAQVPVPLYEVPVYEAAGRVLLDLKNQGWAISVSEEGVTVTKPTRSSDALQEKDRTRKQEHVARDAQLREASVLRFVRSMEATRLWRGQSVSIFSLMAEGKDVAQSLTHFLEGSVPVHQVMRPEIQIVETGMVCSETGILLTDIWRYFRHTWASSYSTVPGRTMQLLIRDRSRRFHPVIGLAALSSPVVQIGVRDQWIGWDTESVLRTFEADPTADRAKWIKSCIRNFREAVWTEDLILEGLLPPEGEDWTDASTISILRSDAERSRARHEQQVSPELKRSRHSSWESKASSALFRARRSELLAEILQAEASLRKFLWPRATSSGLRRALEDPSAARSIRWILRRAKSERVGSVIAELSVCGALPPYSALAAGKLVAMLASSPSVVRAYEQRYSRPSEIASSIAGRAIVKDARLAFIGTTSLYGSGSSQYNRLFWPTEIVGGSPHAKNGFYELGMSRSFGSSHFASQTVAALTRLADIQAGATRVNSIFGEGVSPRMRKVRSGLDALGWPGDALLRHGRQRIVYGCPLVSNLTNFAIGIDTAPEYLLDPLMENDTDQIVAWWFERWAKGRAQNPEILASMGWHTLVNPPRHGAIVPIPRDEQDDSLHLFTGTGN